MITAAESTSPAPARIRAALLEYFDAPGKYPIGSRQPEVLFSAIPEVLQVAAGRAPNAICGGASDELRDAAAFFIGTALLYPGADHYALLGLPGGSNPVRLKERYRLLMRLIHPDFSGSVRANWPSDSAMRVNRAYEVLSSPVHRREYDEQLANSGLYQRHIPANTMRRVAAVPMRTKRVPRLRIGKSAAWSCIVLLSLVAIGMLLPHRDPVRLVQKPKPVTPELSKTALVHVEHDRDLRTPEPGAASATETQATSPSVLSVPPVVELSGPVDSVGLRPSQVEAIISSAVSPPPAPPLAAPAPARPADPTFVGGEARVVTPPPTLGVQSPAPSSASSPPSPTAAPIRVAAIRSRPSPTLTEAQPLLNLLLQSLESGNPDQLLHMLDSEGRQATGAQALSRHYRRLVGRGGRVTLSHVEFNGESKGDVLIVTGDLRLQIGESTIGSLGEKLMLRAEFESRGGQVTLTGLSGAAE